VRPPGFGAPSGKEWFTYFRFYAPTEAFFNKSWAPPDFKKLNAD
jgi:hypothetical protein